jgi:hypothetical protein
MRTESSKSSSLERADLVHMAVGGALGFGITVLLVDIVQNGFLQLLANLNMAGVIFFADFYEVARDLFVFGLVYLTSGFCSGIYAGYNLYPNLKKTLFIPALINSIGSILLSAMINNFALPPASIDIIPLQIAGNIIGTYLGGYAINWGELHEKSEASEKLTLNIRK